MLIDWFTVGAQILNFLILVWLLKRFLYRPILDAIDARERCIARALADADAAKADAARERNDFEQKNAAFDEEQAALLAEAKLAAHTERQRLLDAARQEAAALSARRQASLQREAQSLSREISRRTRQEVFAIAGQALRDLAGARLEERMVAVFVDRLQALSADEKARLAVALQAEAQPIIVRTGFELAPAEQTTASQAIRALLGEKAVIRFATAPDRISGIELSSDGQKLAWSIDGYLAELENSIGELFEAKTAERDPPEKAGADVR